MKVKNVNVEDIKVGKRIRKDLGDLGPMKDSIEARGGLLHAIIISKDNELISGARRLAAWKEVFDSPIPCTVNDGDQGMIEVDENDIRKDWTISEGVEAGKRRAAKELSNAGGTRQGQRTDLKDDELGENFPEVVGRTSEVAAEAGGFGNRKTYEQAKSVVDDGSSETVKAMNAGQVAISAASEFVKAVPDKKEQAQIIKEAKAEVETKEDEQRAVKQAEREQIRKAIPGGGPVKVNKPLTGVEQLLRPLKRAVDEATFITHNYDDSMEKLWNSRGVNRTDRELLWEIVYGLSETFATWKKELEKCRAKETGTKKSSK